MSQGEGPDPELERELRAVFAAQHPRPRFAAELRERLAPRRHWWQPPWEFGAAARWSPALAVVLVMLGVLALLGRVPHGGSGPSSAGSSQRAPAASAGGTFGLLPAPASAPTGRTATVLAPTGPAPAPAQPLPPSAPVYRFRNSEPEFASAVAALAIGAQLPLSLATGAFAEPGFAAPVAEPAVGRDLQQAADTFLAAHHLQPGHPTAVSVDGGGVLYQRMFKLADGTSAPEVDAGGSPTGLRVTVGGGQVRSVSGPLDLPLEVADYPLLAASQARARATGAVPPGSPRLVYVAVIRPGSAYGYFEPAYLFGDGEAAVLLPAIETG